MEEVSVPWAIWWVALGIWLWEILTYFGMTEETLIILTAVLVLDCIFGCIDSFIQWTFSSKILTLGLVKKLSRWCIPFIAIAVMRGAGFDDITFIANVILSILIVAEWYSIIWHIYSINYWESIVEIDALKMLLKWIAEMFKSKSDTPSKWE